MNGISVLPASIHIEFYTLLVLDRLQSHKREDLSGVELRLA